MTKRPKEVRIPKSSKNENQGAAYKNKCSICEEASAHVLNGKHFCEICIESFCDICLQIKPFITVRRDMCNLNDHAQICSDCYLKICLDIVAKDNAYEHELIDERKSDIYCK